MHAPDDLDKLSNSSSQSKQGDIAEDTILMQGNCSDGHQAASGKVTFEARPTISRESANYCCLSAVPRFRGHFIGTGVGLTLRGR